MNKSTGAISKSQEAKFRCASWSNIKTTEMYAIVEIAGQQFKAEEGKTIFVHRLEAEKDSFVEFDRVLLIEEGDNVMVGEPVVPGYVVEGKVLDHVKGDKVIVFKKKRKKGYRVKNGHRQLFSQLEITAIGEKGKLVRKETPKKESKKAVVKDEAAEAVEEVKAVEKKTSAKKTVKKESSAKKSSEKKEAEKKPAAKKASRKKE